LFFGLVLLAIGLVWAGFDWPLGWFCHTDLATLLTVTKRLAKPLTGKEK